MKKTYRVTMKVEIVRYVEANSEEEALDLVDKGDMMHELKHYGVDEEYEVGEAAF